LNSNLSIFGVLFLIFILGCEEPTTLKVDIREGSEAWRLVVDEEPFFVKGAGGSRYFERLEDAGANAIRTWDANRAGEILDSAEAHDLKVMLGLWVQHERHGFNYKDYGAVQKQWEEFREVVIKYKDHPALLLWGVGNEVGFNRRNLETIEAVDDIAKMIQDLDHVHLVTTVTAGVQREEIPVIMQYAPHIDFISVNSYGDIGKVDDSLSAYGYDGPYLITEWGPDGFWESDTTDMGAPIEQSTNEKERLYYQRYMDHILNEPRCMGSFVFLWGQKQERTHSWFGMFDETGRPYGTVKAMEQAWNEEPFESVTAQIRELKVEGRPFTPSATLVGGIVASVEVEGEFEPGAKIRWELYSESTAKSTGGDPEDKPQSAPWLEKGLIPTQALMLTPDTSGAFRLFVTVEQNGYLSSMNVPFNIIREY